jgi:APA family basic amino acid/polyamine antiporter
VPGGNAGAWIVGIAGALACLYVMWGLPKDTWLRLIIWLEIGLAIYGGFGWRHSRLADPKTTRARASMHTPILVFTVLAFIPTMWFAIKVFGTGQ